MKTSLWADRIAVAGLIAVFLSGDVADAQRVQLPVHVAREAQPIRRERGTGEGIGFLTTPGSTNETSVATIGTTLSNSVQVAAEDQRARNALIGALIGGGLVGAYFLRDCYRNDCYWPASALLPALPAQGSVRSLASF